MDGLAGRPPLNMSLNALRVVRDGDAALLLGAGKPVSAEAHIAIIDNAIAATVLLATACKAAAGGDPEPAPRLVADLALDQVEIV